MERINKNNISAINYTKDLDFVFETAEVAILVEDINRNIILTNSLFCSLFNINKGFETLLHTNSFSTFKQISSTFSNSNLFLENIEKNITANKQVVNRTYLLKNGLSITQTFSPLFLENELRGYIWVFKKFQPSSFFSSSDIQLEKVLHFLPNPILVLNSKLEIQFANKAYIGNEEKRLWAKGKTLNQYFSYENYNTEVAFQRENQYNETFKNKTSESWVEYDKQLNKYAQHTIYPIIEPDGSVELIVELCFDITHQKKLEIKLQELVEHFYSILNKVNSVVVETDSTLKVSFLNELWQNKFGKIKESGADKSIFDIIKITHYELYKKVFDILSGNIKNDSGVIEMSDKDENIKQYQYNLYKGFSVDDRSTGVIATLSDVTSQKMQEAQLLELIKKEKELNELKTTFVNMVSHELRTPLTVISSSAEILELLLQNGKGYDEIAVYTKQIIEEVEKMTAFMQDLLMISKIEAGKIEIKTTETDIVNFVTSVINKGFAPYKDGRIANLNVKRINKNAFVDITLLEHSLHNILSNAFKYSVGKKSPVVRVGFSKTYFTISVVDAGIGIPAKDQSKLFTSFFRAGNTGNIAGTGIGLMVAKYFTEQHKGYINFRSKANAGSIFTLKLPYNNE